MDDRVAPQVPGSVRTHVAATGNVLGRGIERRQRALLRVVAETLGQGVHQSVHAMDVSDQIGPRDPRMGRDSPNRTLDSVCS